VFLYFFYYYYFPRAIEVNIIMLFF